MDDAVREAADRVLQGVVDRDNGVPGVVAMATDRDGNFYEGAAGVRELGKGQEMTMDTVFAIFSCTKAITGVTVMQLVEEGVLSLDESREGIRAGDLGHPGARRLRRRRRTACPPA